MNLKTRNLKLATGNIICCCAFKFLEAKWNMLEKMAQVSYLKN